MRFERWSALVVDHLTGSKRRGLDFEDAWRAAMRACGTPTTAAATLFDEQGQPHDTMTVFFKRVCRSAYEGETGPAGSGNGPALKHFRPGMLLEGDERGMEMAA